jgi:hypothetical protein
MANGRLWLAPGHTTTWQRTIPIALTLRDLIRSSCAEVSDQALVFASWTNLSITWTGGGREDASSRGGEGAFAKCSVSQIRSRMAANKVAQTSSLLFRRLPVGWRQMWLVPFGLSGLMQTGGLRYSRLEVCATTTALPPPLRLRIRW